MKKNKNFICDFIGCNRVFSQINHLKQHKEKLHVSNSYYKDQISRILEAKEELDVDWEEQCDGEIEDFILPTIILRNPELENSIVDINVNINNPDFF